MEAELWNAWERSCKPRLSKRNRERHLPAIAPLGVDEVIVGKALYESRFTLQEAARVLGTEG